MSKTRNSHCFVPGCKTGYKTRVKSAPKVSCSLFTPSAKNLVLWDKAIPRADRRLSRKDRVCELHFHPQHVIRQYECTVGSDTVVIPRGRPLLHEDAVPCIFPNLPSYLSEKVKPSLRRLVKHQTQTPSYVEVRQNCVTIFDTES